MFQLKKIKDKIYLLTFDDHYELCMHFLRIQEFYESSSVRFHEQQFDIFDFMHWYAKKYGNGSFTYPVNWSGFNVPGPIMNKCINSIKNKNRYDLFMESVYQQIYNDNNGPNFYLIGSNSKDKNTIKHELAHALFYTHSGYRTTMIGLINKIPARTRQLMTKKLHKKMYNEDVHADEIQAYLSTGLAKFLNTPSIRKEKKPFIDLYKKYTKKIKL